MPATTEQTRSRNLSMGRRLFAWSAGIFAAAAMCLIGTATVAPSAHAAPSETVTAGDGAVDVVVTVVLAKKGDGPVTTSKELAHLTSQFTRSFGDYRNFEYRGKHALHVTPQQSPTVKLPNGTELTLRHDGQRDGYHQLNLAVGGLKTTVQVHPGATFFQAGRAFDGGVLILAFEVAR